MSDGKINERDIRKIIKEKYSDKYTAGNFTFIINAMKSTFEGKIDEHDLIDFLSEYLYVTKDNRYTFNLKKRKKEKDFDTISFLTNITPPCSESYEEYTESEVVVESDEVVITNDVIVESNEILTSEDELVIDSDEKIVEESELDDSDIETDSEESYSEEEREWEYPKQNYKIIKRTDEDNGPYGSQWANDVQVDDQYDQSLWDRGKIFDKLRSVILPVQRSPEWFAMRHCAITASDGGTVLGKNKYDHPYKFLLKKCTKVPFLSNKFCYHGKKHEEIATMVYEYRMNVRVEEFGLMMHPKYSFLGASPDGIVCRTKLDKKHRTKYVGRMLEIKCPFSRQEWKDPDVPAIDMNNPKNRNVMCPLYYWVQMQLQLECCDLEECDFWQADIKEYRSRDEFLEDTDPDEPFRSRTTGFEKGCLIQYLPKSKMDEIHKGDSKTYWQVVYEDADFFYPSQKNFGSEDKDMCAADIEMSPADCDRWIANAMNYMSTNRNFYDNYVFDKVIYWKIEKTRNHTFSRDRKWFAKALPEFKKIWNYVLFLRQNPDKLKIFVDYVESMSMKRNEKIMDLVENLFNDSGDPDLLETIAKQTKENQKKKEEKRRTKEAEKTSFSEFVFI